MTETMMAPVWEDGDWRTLPALTGVISADVCVVGLGGSGLACIEELLEGGATVVGLDARGVAGGAAGRNGGFLLAGLAPFYHDVAEWLGRERASRIYRLTLEEMDRMASADPDMIRRVGSLRIAASPEEEADCAAQFAAMTADSLPVEWYEGMEGVGLRFPRDGVYQPLRRCRRVAERVMGRGALLFEHSPVTRLRSGRVETVSGVVSAERIIVAVDGGLERIFPELERRVRTARLQMLATAPAAEVSIPHPVYFRWGYEYWQQLEDGRIALGGFRDQGGSGEWTHDTAPDDRVQSRLEHFLREHLKVSAPVTHRWAASVGFSHGILPVLTEVRPRIWAVGGYSGTGNVLGSLAGRAAAGIALRGGSELAIVASDEPLDAHSHAPYHESGKPSPSPFARGAT